MFWQNVSSAVGCEGGHVDCMRKVDFATLTSAASEVQENYTYQFQPRVDGDFVADTCRSLPLSVRPSVCHPNRMQTKPSSTRSVSTSAVP